MIVLTLLISCRFAAGPEPWPAEPISDAVKLTTAEGVRSGDFGRDLSGASWNPMTRRLWVIRNGPKDTTSKLWLLRPRDDGSFELDVRDGRRGEWTGFGDAEGVTQTDLDRDVVFVLDESKDRITAYDVSTFGTAVRQNEWNMKPFLPHYDGSHGAEGITFVPDESLAKHEFADADGKPRVSRGGLGGLNFIAHQSDGRIYVFDLNRIDGSIVLVGAYLTEYSESAGLEFDRTSGLLYILHGDRRNSIEVTKLSSSIHHGKRRLDTVTLLDRPAGSKPKLNIEGIAVTSESECRNGQRSLFVTIDNASDRSLLQFRRFPCHFGKK